MDIVPLPGRTLHLPPPPFESQRRTHLHHLPIIVFNEPTVVHRLVSVSTGVGLFTNAPRNALAKSQAMFTKLKPVHLCYTTGGLKGGLALSLSPPSSTTLSYCASAPLPRLRFLL